MPFEGKDAATQRLRENAEKYMRALALEALARLMRKTPVDTGRARANWNVALGSPDRSTDEDRTIADAGRAQAEGVRVIAEFGPGRVLYVTNSLPYIQDLEDGRSKQAPQGMVKVTVAELKPLASRIAARIAAGGE
ncbi:MAG TPA: HK97 gp10 family phage protein [Longimicrobiales bacterium]